jgi:hypothetical protein
MEATRNLKEVDLEAMGFQLRFENRWARVVYQPDLKVVICQLLSDYVPIEHFRSMFQQISALIENGDFTKFIFDKRSLRTFHQPSMEWYFLYWKQEMMGYGLLQHRKILPNLDWFKTAVAIERGQLAGKMSPEAVEKLDIKYCDNIPEAIRI